MPKEGADHPNPEPTWYQRAVASLERIGLKALSTGDFGWFVVLVIALAGIWKLDSKDLKDVLMTVLGQFGWLGYPFAGITVLVAIRLAKWREGFYNQEMDRVAEVKRVAVQRNFEFPLQSTVETKKKTTDI